MAGITSPYGGTYTAIDALLTTTLQHYDEKGTIQDAVFLANPTFRKLFQGGKVKTVNGGAQIVVNLMYGSNTTVGSRGKYEEVDISPQDGMTQSFANWALYQQAISIDDHEIDQNMGEGKLKDLMDAKYEQMTMTWGELLSDHLYDIEGITTATGASGNGGKNITPIPMIVDIAPNSSSILQGVDGGTYAWWRNQYVADASGYSTDDTWKSGMAKMYNNCFRQGSIGGEIDLIVMSQDGYETYESTLEAYKMYTSSDKASAGFKNLVYKNAEIVWDPYMCDSFSTYNWDNTTPHTNNTMYFLNTKFLSVNVMKGKQFASTPFVRPTNQAARTALNLATLQLVCSNRRKHGVIAKVPLMAGMTIAT
jgi:hypothetical protein